MLNPSNFLSPVFSFFLQKFGVVKPYVNKTLRRAFTQKCKSKAMVVECMDKCKCDPSVCPRFVQVFCFLFYNH